MSLFDDPPLRDFPDRALRRLLEEPANLRELFDDLRPELSARLDFSRLEMVPRTFLMEDWRERECDLFFRIPYRTEGAEQWVMVCVLVEHQSAPDPRMPLRLLVYAAHYWESEWKKWEAGHEPYAPLRLTPIIPVVFYTGHNPWNAGRQFANLFAVPDELRAFAPQWQTLFWDLSETDPQALLSSAAAWLQALAVVRAEHADLAQFKNVLAQVVPKLAELRGEARMRSLDLLWFVLSWVMNRRPSKERPDLLATLQTIIPDPETRKEISAMSGTLGQTWQEEMEENAAQREARAKEQATFQATLQTTRDNLRTLLEERFGSIPDSLAQRIEATEDVDRLRACLRQAVHAGSPAELQL